MADENKAATTSLHERVGKLEEALNDVASHSDLPARIERLEQALAGQHTMLETKLIALEEKIKTMRKLVYSNAGMAHPGD